MCPGARYSNEPGANIMQVASQVQKAPLPCTSHPSIEQATREWSVDEICRQEDQKVQGKLVIRIEQAVFQLGKDTKNQSDLSNAAERSVNQWLNTPIQTMTEEMPNVSRNLKKLRGDVNSLGILKVKKDRERS